MNRRPHDSSRPQTAPCGARSRDEKLYAETASAPRADGIELRSRVNFHSADCVSLRLEQAGCAAGLKGAVGEVLQAVITMLPRQWSKVRDTRIRLRQLVNLCPSRPHPRTVGRALRRLEGLEIIHYTPAQGRGTSATIVVHERFLDGVEELARNESGAALVPFSGPDTSSFPRGKDLNRACVEPAPDEMPECRPVEVAVDRSELQELLGRLPPLYSDLPRNLRFLLRQAIRAKLALGHRPEQILQILQAPTPPAVQRPFRLAMWRLHQNVVGPGPLLRPLQRRWDREQRVREDQARIAELAEDYRRVEAVTTADQRDQLIAAIQELFGPAEDPRTAVLTAVRRARRQYPGIPGAAAVTAWLDHGDHRLTPRRERTLDVNTATCAGEGRRVFTSIAGTDCCAGCGGSGVLRAELPIPTVACNACLAAASVETEEQSWPAAS